MASPTPRSLRQLWSRIAKSRFIAVASLGLMAPVPGIAAHTAQAPAARSAPVTLYTGHIERDAFAPVGTKFLFTSAHQLVDMSGRPLKVKDPVVKFDDVDEAGFRAIHKDPKNGLALKDTYQKLTTDANSVATAHAPLTPISTSAAAAPQAAHASAPIATRQTAPAPQPSIKTPIVETHLNFAQGAALLGHGLETGMNLPPKTSTVRGTTYRMSQNRTGGIEVVPDGKAALKINVMKNERTGDLQAFGAETDGTRSFIADVSPSKIMHVHCTKGYTDREKVKLFFRIKLAFQLSIQYSASGYEGFSYFGEQFNPNNVFIGNQSLSEISASLNAANLKPLGAASGAAVHGAGPTPPAVASPGAKPPGPVGPIAGAATPGPTKTGHAPTPKAKGPVVVAAASHHTEKKAAAADNCCPETLAALKAEDAKIAALTSQLADAQKTINDDHNSIDNMQKILGQILQKVSALAPKAAPAPLSPPQIKPKPALFYGQPDNVLHMTLAAYTAPANDDRMGMVALPLGMALAGFVQPKAATPVGQVNGLPTNPSKAPSGQTYATDPVDERRRATGKVPQPKESTTDDDAVVVVRPGKTPAETFGLTARAAGQGVTLDHDPALNEATSAKSAIVASPAPVSPEPKGFKAEPQRIAPIPSTLEAWKVCRKAVCESKQRPDDMVARARMYAALGNMERGLSGLFAQDANLGLRAARYAFNKDNNPKNGFSLIDKAGLVDLVQTNRHGMSEKNVAAADRLAKNYTKSLRPVPQRKVAEAQRNDRAA